MVKHVAVIAFAATCVLFLAAATSAPAQVQVDGYRIDRYWEPGGGDPRALMNGPGGRIWVGCGDGSLRILEGPSDAGTARGATIFTRGLWNPNGIAWRPRPGGKGYEIFVCHTTVRHGGNGRVTRLIDKDGNGTLDDAAFVILNLPPGAHQTNNIAFGPDGKLYFAQGATSDRGPGGGALIGRVDPDATNLRWGDEKIEFFASGLRNPWGIAFHPNGQLFATDNSSDKLGDKTPPDELNVIVEGGHYGFPEVEGQPPEGHASVAPIGDLGIHTAPSGITFDPGHRFPGVRGQAFVALWGSWTGDPGASAGTGIVRVQLHRTKAGEWKVATHALLRNCGRPLDVLVGSDGALYFTVQTSTKGWREAVYRMVPTTPITLVLGGEPVAGGTVTATLRAAAHPRAKVRVRIDVPGAKPAERIVALDATGTGKVVLPVASAAPVGATAKVTAAFVDAPKAASAVVPITLF